LVPTWCLYLLNYHPEHSSQNSAQTKLSRGQKIALGGCAGGLIVFAVLATFACIFIVRLVPVAFPGPTQTPLAFTATVPPTSTLTATPMPSLTPTQTATPTATPSPTMTSTALPAITATREIYFGVMTGSVWLRLAPDAAANIGPVPVGVNTKVELLAVHNGWIKISWTTEFGTQTGWVRQSYVGIAYPLPSQLVTPVK
jgi:hypothetical protein